MVLGESFMSLDPKNTTLEQAQDWLRKQLDGGAQCPCCKQHAKIYRRKLNSGMAASLIAFAKVTQQSQPKDGWLKVPDDFVQTSKLVTVLKNREYNKLKHWGLLEGQGPDQSLHAETHFTGMWRLTELGFKFVRGEAEVPESVYLYDNRRMRVSDEMTTIKIALGSKFNYTELMESSAA